MATSESNNFSTFEVTFSANEQAVQALYGLGNTLGWRISERVILLSDLEQRPIPKCLQISSEDLTTISKDVWGVEMYGETATNFLDEMRLQFYEPHFRIRTSLSDTSNEVIAYERLAIGPGRHTYHLEDRSMFPFQTAKIEELLAEIWPSTSYPFGVPTVTAYNQPQRDGSHLTQDWFVEPGGVNRVRLAHYSRCAGLDQHNSQGSIGKALDVINIASGLVSKETIADKPDPNLAFIDYAELRAQLKTAHLTRDAKAEIINVIITSLDQQITGNRYAFAPAKPVIVEGKGGWTSRSHRRFPVFEKIACLSLAQLFDGEYFTAERHIAPREYLKQFA